MRRAATLARVFAITDEMPDPDRHHFTADSFELRPLRPADIDLVVELQRTVVAPLPDGFVRPRPPEELAAYLDGSAGAAFGVVDSDWLAAAALLRLPSPARPNAGRPMPLVPAADWPRHACFVENAMVRHAARGHGLQRLLFDARRAHAARAGMRWICAGVHVHNTHSWTNLVTMGMTIVGIRFDTGQPLFGLLDSLGAAFPHIDDRDLALVRALDAERHEVRLAEGYVGVRLAHDGALIYARRLDASPGPPS
jgi:hypothetical protein